MNEVTKQVLALKGEVRWLIHRHQEAIIHGGLSLMAVAVTYLWFIIL